AGLGDKDFRRCVGYGLLVVRCAVFDIYPSGPTDENLRELAKKIVEKEADWVDLGDVERTARFLGAVAQDDPSFGGLDPDELMLLTFVCGGHLLSRYRLEDQRWWDYLNEIWDKVLAMPEPASSSDEPSGG